nr:ABC transporter ATP-binding protein [Sphingomonas kyeonggiensis]
MLRLERICRQYNAPARTLAVLDTVTLSVERGEFCAIVGPSGSGKSTLLNIIGLLDRPCSGRLEIGGEAIRSWTPHATASLRNRLIGFVFQSFQLLPRLTAWQNVALPLQYRGVARPARREVAEAMLARVGLAAWSDHLPSQLSGGQCQRVAIARALVGQPQLLLADEPTGSLDSATSREVMALLRSLNAELGITVLMVTHDQELAASCPRQIRLRDGRIVEGSEARAA